MEGSAWGILLEDARLSKPMVVQSLVYSENHQGPFWSQHSPAQRREQFAFFTTGLDSSMAVSGEMKGHRDGDRTTSLSGFFNEKITLGFDCLI